MFLFTKSPQKGYAFGNEAGQASVEAAFLIPVILLMFLFMLQPAIILYDRMVMQAAAAEGCRVLATKPADANDAAYKNYVLRRLGSIPEEDHFHVHSQGCSWEIELWGSEISESARVSISTQIKPLPLIEFVSSVLGLVNGAGNFEEKIEIELPTKNTWVSSNDLGLNPRAWVDQWE